MKEYLKRRTRSSRLSTFIGVAVAVAAHALALCLISFNGLKYIYPPPVEQSFLIDFSNEQEIIEQKYGKEPVAEKVDREKPIELVQRSESPIKDNTPNETPAQEPDDFGDVDVPTPPVEPEQPKIDPRAAFPGMGKKDSKSGTAHAAQDSSNRFKAGQPDGNSSENITEGRSNAHLLGRKVDGDLIAPNYKRQDSGVVVVTIWVDVHGNVQKAIPGAPGTTVDDANLWAEARSAAMRTHFTKVTNITADTPQLQEGTITYIFKLK
ncbi:MAG: hypothetical protein J5667_04985 [Bacteroidales bacterium]|nr:hypothetical protein [Bacteroidales bacterium]